MKSLVVRLLLPLAVLLAAPAARAQSAADWIIYSTQNTATAIDNPNDFERSFYLNSMGIAAQAGAKYVIVDGGGAVLGGALALLTNPGQLNTDEIQYLRSDYAYISEIRIWYDDSDAIYDSGIRFTTTAYGLTDETTASMNAFLQAVSSGQIYQDFVDAGWYQGYMNLTGGAGVTDEGCLESCQCEQNGGTWNGVYCEYAPTDCTVTPDWCWEECSSLDEVCNTDTCECSPF